MKLSNRCIEQLKKRKYDGNYRVLKVTQGLIDFSSNDYLGLARERSLSGTNQQHIKEPLTGSTGSRLLTGNNSLALDTEKYLADIFNSEEVLILNSGYTANLAVLSTLPQRGDYILYDELCHASIKDGMRLSNAKRISFSHNDLSDLKNKLDRLDGNKYIVVESVYSMDGDEAPLEELVKLTKQYNSFLIVDEAHATGLFGRHGGGICELKGLEKDIFCRIYTFGKALGYHGAAIAGSQDLKNYLINFARPVIYTTALPPESYVTIRKRFDYIYKNPNLQSEVRMITQFFIDEFEERLHDKFMRTDSYHPIQTILIKGNEKASLSANKLQKAGFDARAILSPTVKEGQERLRICLHTYNSRDEVSGLVHKLAVI